MKLNPRGENLRSDRVWLLSLVFASLACVTGCNRAESDWKAAQSVNTVAAYNDFLGKHPQNSHIAEVRQAIDVLDWNDAKSKSTVDAFNAYLLKNAQGKYVAEAKSSIENLDWKAAQAKGSVESYEAYVRSHAESAHALTARELLATKIEERDWQSATEANSFDAWTAFLAKHPKSTRETEARASLEKVAFAPSKEMMQTCLEEAIRREKLAGPTSVLTVLVSKVGDYDKGRGYLRVDASVMVRNGQSVFILSPNHYRARTDGKGKWTADIVWN